MEKKYYLSVKRDEEYVVKNKSFVDLSLAIEACNGFYKSKYENSVLSFTSEMIDGIVVRCYTELMLPDDIGPKDERYNRAVKYSNIFDYSASYFFLIEVDTENKKSRL